MQICARCGNPMAEGASCCPRCGAPNAFVNKQQFNQYIRERRKRKKSLEKEQESAFHYQEQMKYYEELEKQQKREYRHRRRRRVAIASVAAYCLVVAATVLITFGITREEDEGSRTVSTTQEIESGQETTAWGTSPATSPAPEPDGASDTAGNGTVYKQTVMVYIVGSDLESQMGAASMDIQEMEQSGLDPEVVNCLAYTGGSYSWSSDISPNQNSVYHIRNGSKELVASEEQKNMGEASTLTGFIDYCYENYPADKFTLILWDHGAGPVWGYGADSLANDDGLEMDELASALAASRLCQSERLETIVFDACLMGSLEVASLLKPYASYLVGSEDVVAGYGLDYSFLKDMSQTGMDGAKVGTGIVDCFYNFYSTFSTSNENTLTCVDLSKVDAVEDALNQLFAQVDDRAQHDERRAERAELYEYGTFDGGSYDLVDVSRLAESMQAQFGSSAGTLTDAVQSAVVYHKTTGSNAMGLTVYYPYSYLPAAPDSMQVYRGFGFAENYTEFIGEFSDWEMDRRKE